MKKVISLLLLLPLLFACDKDSNRRNNNPFLPDYSFSVSINMNLPQYNGLTNPITPVAIDIEGAGISGLIAMKISDTDYRIWEASCPNQYPSGCSKMTFEPGSTTITCSCEDFAYDIFSGVGGGTYTMKPYRYEIQGNVIRMYN